MRKGNKTRLIIALLAAVLVFNTVAFAQNDGVEAEYELYEVPNSLDAAVDGEPDSEEAEAQAAIMAAVEEGMVIAPGKVITHNGKTYRIKDNATNVAAQMGGFDVAPTFASTGETDTLILQDDGAAWNYISNDGHNSPGCVEFQSGTFIWRHYFTQDTLYVYSAWWKVQGNFNFQDDQRQIEGAYDPDTGSSHINEIGRNREITYDWQQDVGVFKGKSSERRFLYVPVNGGSVRLDDVYIYEVEVIDSLEIGSTVIEDPVSWDTYTNIPEAGVNYNCVINYTVNVTEPMKFNGVLALFKDGKLYGKIVQKPVTSRTAVLNNGDLTSATGAVSIPFKIDAGEDISKFSCVAYLSEEGKPFNVYGNAGSNYAAVIYGAAE